MADVKISALTGYTSPSSASDVLPIVDVTASATKKITLTNLITYIAAFTVALTNKTISLASNTVTGTIAQFNAALSDGDFATLAGSETLTNKTLTAPIVGGAASLSAAATVDLALPTSDGTATGLVTSAFNCGYSSSAVGDLVILDSSATWQKTDANTASIYSGLLGIALEVKASGAALKVALPGSFVYATGFPTFTVGGAVYMSETAGAVTQTAPTTTDAATRLIGYAFHADKLYFNPSNDWITHT